MNQEKPIRLILVRHGNTFESNQTPIQVGARTDLPLTSQGCSQAQSVAQYLASEKLQPYAIYAGALKRQIETAEIISRHFQVKNVHLQEPALTEIDYGTWEGLTSEQIIQQWPQEYQAWTQQGQWVHCFGGTQEGHIRAIEQWLELLRGTCLADKTVIGVTSNGVIRFFYSLKGKNKNSSDFQIEDLKVKTGHFCELLLFKDSLQIKSWNRSPKNIDTKN